MTTSSGIVTSSPPLDAPLPTLPFDLIPEILCRLPVKLLLQLKCVCKSWKSLISNLKFAKKHLHMSTMCHHHHHHHLLVTSMNTSNDSLLWNSPISSIFSDTSSTSAIPQLQLNELMYSDNPLKNGNSRCVISSCDGILLFVVDLRSPLLWNPSITFKILPPLLNPQQRVCSTLYTFGYDHFIDSYKVIAISIYINKFKVEVSVYTLGIDSWRMLDDFPSDGLMGLIDGPGVFVSGNVNWLAIFRGPDWVIVSFDLEKETYRKLSTPDSPDFDTSACTFGVLRDCLCIITNIYEFCAIWVMKEYGVEDSWTHLFTIPYLGSRNSYAYNKVLYVSEDDQMLLNLKEKMDLKMVVFDPRNSPSFKIPKIENIDGWMVSEVYVESLISPCSPGRECVPLWRERYPRLYLLWLPLSSIIFSLILSYFLSYLYSSYISLEVPKTKGIQF